MNSCAMITLIYDFLSEIQIISRSSLKSLYKQNRRKKRDMVTGPYEFVNID